MGTETYDEHGEDFMRTQAYIHQHSRRIVPMVDRRGKVEQPRIRTADKNLRARGYHDCAVAEKCPECGGMYFILHKTGLCIPCYSRG